MTRLWTTRIMLGLAGLLALALAFSLPAPSRATSAQLWAQVTLLAVYAACMLALVVRARRPAFGRWVTLLLGLYGVLMFAWRGKALLLAVREGGMPQLLSALVPLSLWCALLIAGVCSLGSDQQRKA